MLLVSEHDNNALHIECNGGEPVPALQFQKLPMKLTMQSRCVLLLQIVLDMHCTQAERQDDTVLAVHHQLEMPNACLKKLAIPVLEAKCCVLSGVRVHQRSMLMGDTKHELPQC